MKSHSPGSTLDRLARAVAAAPADDALWTVYADALSEVGELPPFFERALTGAPPDPATFGYLQHHLESRELQVRFNRFHFIEAAWILPQSSAGYELILRDLLFLPAGRFLQRVSYAIFPAPQWSNELGQLRAIQYAFEHYTGPLYSLRELTVGLSPEPQVPPQVEAIVRLIEPRAPYFQTRADTMVKVVKQVRVRLVECPPGVKVGALVPGELLSVGSTHIVGAAAEATGEAEVAHVITAPQPVTGSFTVQPADSVSNYVAISAGEASPVRLDGVPFFSRYGGRLLVPGDTIEIDPGIVFRAEEA